MTLYLFQFAALNNLPNQIAGFLQDNVDDQVLQSENIAEWCLYESCFQADYDISGSKKSEISVMRIAEYILTTVGRRRVPGGGRGAVVMKLDVEGREMSIIGQY